MYQTTLPSTSPRRWRRAGVLSLSALLGIGLLSVAALSAAEETAPAWIGYGGPNGSRIYAEATPPTSFGEADIVWSTEFPDKGWGYGSPIVVGDKVIVGLEFDERHGDFPSLIALNVADGSIAWSALLDHTPEMTHGAKVRKVWCRYNDDGVLLTDLVREYRSKKTKEERQVVADKVQAAGFQVRKGGRLMFGTSKAITKQDMGLLKRNGFMADTWRGNRYDGGNWGGSCVGQMYATPVSDGKRIYATTALGGFFAIDLEGKQLWCTASPGQLGEYCRNGRSPILWTEAKSGKTLLISDITNKVRAFDADTGKIQWTDDAVGDFKYGTKQGGGAHTIVTPAVMNVGGTEILLAAGLNAYRLPDGKRLTIEGWDVRNYGLQTLVKHDERDVVFLCGSGEHSGWAKKGGTPDNNPPVALRFSLEGDNVLKATVLWDGRDLHKNKNWNSRIGGGNAPWMLYHDGKFYHREGAIVEALTGKHVAGQIYSKGRNQAVPQTGHLLCVAGEHVFGRRKNKMSVYTLDGKKVSDNTLPKEAAHYGHTFTFAKSSIYVRGKRCLMRIGK